MSQGGSIDVATLVTNVLWAQQTACLNDTETCQYCGIVLASGKLSDLQCSDCFLKYMASLLSSWHGSGRASPSDFDSLVKQCKADPSKYPTLTWTAPSFPEYVLSTASKT
jgi:hypothetical protein